MPRSKCECVPVRWSGEMQIMMDRNTPYTLESVVMMCEPSIDAQIQAHGRWVGILSDRPPTPAAHLIAAVWVSGSRAVPQAHVFGMLMALCGCLAASGASSRCCGQKQRGHVLPAARSLLLLLLLASTPPCRETSQTIQPPHPHCCTTCLPQLPPPAAATPSRMLRRCSSRGAVGLPTHPMMDTMHSLSMWQSSLDT